MLSMQIFHLILNYLVLPPLKLANTAINMHPSTMLHTLLWIASAHWGDHEIHELLNFWRRVLVVDLGLWAVQILIGI